MSKTVKIIISILGFAILFAGIIAGTYLVQKNQDIREKAASNDTITFAVIGDYGADNSSELAVANMVKGWNPDFIITTGDNNYESGAASTIDNTIGKYYSDFIGNYKGTYGTGSVTNRFFPTPGNHDHVATNAQPYIDYFTLPGKEYYYDFVKGPVHFFTIDHYTLGGTSQTGESAQWLKAGLAASTSEWNVVYFHAPPYSSGTGNGSYTPMRWPFKEWGADIVMSGHEHSYERLSVDGITYFVNGSGGRSLYAMGTPIAGSQARDNTHVGAMLVTVGGGKFNSKFYGAGNLLIDDYTQSSSVGVGTSTPTPSPVATVVPTAVSTLIPTTNPTAIPTAIPSGSTSGGVIVPLYTFPGATWTQMISSKLAHPAVSMVAIVNPSNGPGSSINSNYTSGINNLRSAGIKVLGYVYTQYGARDPKPDIDKWKSFYNIDGIFFDEMSNQIGKENFYSDLNSYAKSKGYSFTVGNPGTDTKPSYIGTVDNIMIYEGSGLPNLSSLGGWHSSYNKNNFTIIPYGVATLDTGYVQLAKNYVGFIYITNDTLPNPWDSLPPYFDSLVNSLDVGVVQPSPTPAITNYSAWDIDQNGLINLVDIGLVIDEYGNPNPKNPRADVNKDGAVNIIDIGVIIDHYLL